MSEVQSINIIEDAEGEMRVATSVIAHGMELEHRQVIRAVRNFQSDLEQFGRVDFENQAFETAGGTQHREIARLNEHQAMFLLTSFRNIGLVKEFKVALVKEFYRMRQALAQTAQVALPSARQLALMVIEAEDARVAAEARAAVAESFKEQIELNDGLTVRDFHKKYFSEHRETDVNNFFYRSRLLIDERNKRWDEENKRWKDGKNHRRPSFQGKAFFYLHGELDRDKVRREHTRVRPGAPELALVEYMTKRGFVANRSENKELTA